MNLACLWAELVWPPSCKQVGMACKSKEVIPTDVFDQVAMDGGEVREVITLAQFEAAYRSSFSRTVNRLAARGVSRETAEDLAQAAWARGWEYREQLRNPSLVSWWVGSIARNLLFIAYRGRKPTEQLTESCATVSPDWRPLLVERLLRDLPTADRDLLVETYAFGSTSYELGPKMGVSATAIRVRLNRLRKTLRGIVDGTGKDAERSGYATV
jgi:DNA-directed RNA polymerase specialized sigma24 family protein